MRTRSNPMRVEAECSEDGCTEPSRGLGPCQSHYYSVYNARPENKARAQEKADARGALPGFKEKRAAHDREYRAKPEVMERNKIRDAAYRATPEYKARALERRTAPGFQAYRRERNLVNKYGLLQEDYDRILAEQGGGCANCGLTNDDGRQLAVDHDHACCPGDKSCGKCVRGLLCVGCNLMLGYAKDDPDLLIAAADYLKKWQQMSEVA